MCEAAGLGPRASAAKVGRSEAERLFTALQETKIRPPSTDCIVPIGSELLLKGLKTIVPGEFHDAMTRPPAVYRGSPFQIEVALAYGGAAQSAKVTKDELIELIQQSDARTLRKFLIDTFSGVGSDAADKIIAETKLPTRCSPQKLKKADLEKLHEAMHSVNTSKGRQCRSTASPIAFPCNSNQVHARLPSCAQYEWRAYGLSQSRGALPSGPVTLIVHMASVWVPFTSESKEAIASYPEIEKELRLALQKRCRNLAGFVRKRQAIQKEGNRRSVFLRYLREVAESRRHHQKSGLPTRLRKIAQRRQKENGDCGSQTRRIRKRDRRG